MFNYSFGGLNYPIFYPNRRYIYQNMHNPYSPYSRSFPSYNNIQNHDNFSKINQELNMNNFNSTSNKLDNIKNRIENSNTHNNPIDKCCNSEFNKNDPETNNLNKKNSTTEDTSRCTICDKSNQKEQAVFRIFGLDLFFDDILILCLLFFLYTEEVKDEMLFICLIMLLLS